ncbi:MAG: hypothetical protein KY396_06680 [Actinobacteria bacterium]|nr:hypothetical protein [Actinomycetota bacterium]
MPLAFWHNPDDFLDWLVVVAAFLVVALVVALGVALFVAWIRAARKR